MAVRADAATATSGGLIKQPQCCIAAAGILLKLKRVARRAGPGRWMHPAPWKKSDRPVAPQPHAAKTTVGTWLISRASIVVRPTKPAVPSTLVTPRCAPQLDGRPLSMLA